MLGLDSLQGGEPKNIYYTNYDNNKNIENRVNNLFNGHMIRDTGKSISIAEAFEKHFELF